MQYYRVKADCDGYPRYKYVGNTDRLKVDGNLVGEELYTPKERQRIANADKFFEKVEIPISKIYYFFGARFEDNGVYIV